MIASLSPFRFNSRLLACNISCSWLALSTSTEMISMHRVNFYVSFKRSESENSTMVTKARAADLAQ